VSEPRKTPLYERHVELGGRIVDFAGWWLPVQYAGILEEHRAVREQAGLFDVSHMGEIRVVGTDAEAFVQKMFTNELATLQSGKVRYSPMCYPTGGTVDDVLIYRLALSEFLLVVNAGNKDKDFSWLLENAAGFDVSITDESAETAEIALQGPAAAAIMGKLSGSAPSQLAYYEFLPQHELAGLAVLISRTGYTGEDGFEIYCKPAEAAIIWVALLEAGKEHGLQPAGLGCRDTLRFEASMPLYGHELSADISPLEAGLAKFVSFDKIDFNGREALLRQQEMGPKRKLVGFEMIGRGVARSGYLVLLNDQKIGSVTSGSFAPALGKNLGMALVDREAVMVGTKIEIEIREKLVEAQVIKKPFYRRK